MFYRSPNCTNFTNQISTIVGAHATERGNEKNCSVSKDFLSCQTNEDGKAVVVDDITKGYMAEQFSNELKARGCNVDKMEITSDTFRVGSQTVNKTGEQLEATGLASNCYASAPSQHDMQVYKASCTCQKSFHDTNEKNNGFDGWSLNTHKQFKAQLATCDTGVKAMAAFEEDLKTLVRHNATMNGITIGQNSDLACTFQAGPIV